MGNRTKVLNRIAMIYLAILAGGILLGCSKISHDTLVGTYICHFPEATEELQLNVDGTYEQRVSRDDGKTIPEKHSGKWHLIGSGSFLDDLHVELEDSWIVHDPWGDFDPNYEKNPLGLQSYPVDEWFGKIYFMLHPDTAWHFDKVK